MNLHYTEAFYSLQGEGKFMGVPSVFLRTFGCNFRCKKFGRDKNELITGPNPEVVEVIKDIQQYAKFEDLPLVTTGCDTYSSIYPEFKRFVKKADVQGISDLLVNLTPEKRWGDIHLVITGGEPLLGWQKFWAQLFFWHWSNTKSVPVDKPRNITFETNGTQALSDELMLAILDYGRERFTFSISPKLSCSGERWEDAIKPEVVSQLGNYDSYLKFVVSTKQDVDEAEYAVASYRNAGYPGPVYLMPVGGIEEVYKLNNRAVADYALSHGWRFSDRLQVALWKNAWNT